MKKLITFVFGLCLLATACELETSKNGDLDGLWQLKTVDTLASGHSADMRQSHTWWAIQGKMLQMHDSVKAHPDVIGSFTHNGNTLRVFGLYFSVRDAGDQKVEDPDVLHTLGLHQLEEDLKVLKLDGSEMQLETATLRLYFRKY